MTGFDRLHPALQHHIVNSLGWRSLRRLQDEAIGPLLDGEHALLVAPTAGGKTEAAILPLLSRVLTEGWPALSILYLCPLKALLNNLEIRLSSLAGLVGRRVELWHGDVGESARRAIRRDPPDILLTTPESLEALLISRRTDREGFFGKLRAVVVDELHAFAGDDRGWHLLCVTDRVQRVAGRSLQRVGLSATIGNPDQILDWLAGAAAGPRRVVAPPSADLTPPELGLDHVGSLENAATVIAALHRGEKRLVFCDSRSRVESLAAALRGREVSTFVSHGSLGIEERRSAERAFAEGRDCVIVATSALELGIDVGDLDRVVQIDAPGTVASILQRLGRTGRRPGTVRNCLFLTTTDAALLQAAGLLDLLGRGFVEPVVPPPEPWHLFAQQILALVIQESGLGRSAWKDWLGAVPAFRDLDPQDTDELIEHLLRHGILFDDQGILGIGPEGEASYGFRNFRELTSIFSTSPLVTVRYGAQELGQVHELSFQAHRGESAVLLLGGRPWAVVRVDWPARVAHVVPAEGRGRSLWLGTGLPLHAELCRAIRRVLVGADPPAQIYRRATDALAALREEHFWVSEDATTLVRGRDGVAWWTFAGLLANRMLAGRLRALGADPAAVGNLLIPLSAAATVDAVRRELAGEEPPPAVVLPAGHEDELKFAECLPARLLGELQEARLADEGAVSSVLSERVAVAQGP